MDPRLKNLRKRKDALQQESDKILAKPRGERTDEERERLEAIIGTPNDGGGYEGGELAEVNADIAEYHRAVELERQEANRRAVAEDPNEPGSGRAPATVHGKPGFRSLGEQLQAIAKASLTHGRETDPRLEELHRIAAATGASESIPQDGGFLVQRDFTAELLSRGTEASMLLPRCRRFPIDGSGLDAPVIDETSRATGSRFGGVQVYRNHEAESVTATKPKFGKMKMDLEDLTALAYATDNLLEDAGALEGIFATAFESEFAWKIDNEILRGTGAGEMLGILQAAALVTVAKETGQNAATIVYENVIKMWARLWARSMPNLIWLHNQDTLPQLMQMHQVIGTGGVPVWLPPGGASGSPYASLLGRPLIPMEQCSTLGTVGDLIAADLSQFLVIEKRGGLQSAQSMHVRFINHEQTFRWKLRNNGQPMWSSALTPANGTNTLSPFVALATRA